MNTNDEECIEAKRIQDWDTFFMTLCLVYSMKSKDPRTRVGAYIVGPDNEEIASGFNGLPRHVKESNERSTKPLKNFYYSHAEENAICNAARSGVSLKNCRLYVLTAPCATCARLIVQSGIKEVIIYKKTTLGENWSESLIASSEILKEGGVKVRHTDKVLNSLELLFDGKIIDLK